MGHGYAESGSTGNTKAVPKIAYFHTKQDTKAVCKSI